jgi:hypothetical protein
VKKLIASFIFLGGLLTLSGPAFAHHGRGVAFDDAHMMTASGTVTKVDWINPHAFIFFDVKDEKTGEVKNWGIEWTNPRSLIRLGLDPSMFKEGTTVKMKFSPAKSGAPRGEIIQAWSADGKMIYDGSAGYKGNIDDLFDQSTVKK